MPISPSLKNWLGGPKSDPSVRVRYLIELQGRAPTDPRVRRAAAEIGRKGWAASLLRMQWPDGHWGPPGTSGPELFRPKFIATHWAALALSELGMTRADPRIRKAAELILDRYTTDGLEAPLDYRPGRRGEICVTGMITRTLLRFGYLDHAAVQRSIDWIVRVQKSDGGWNHDGIRSGTLDAFEGLAALAAIPEPERTAGVRRSIDRGAEFYLRRRLVREGTPRYPPWYRIHFPNQNYYDALVGLRILTGLGFGRDPRMAPALAWLRRKRRADGRWSLDASAPDLPPDLAEFYYGDEIVFPMRFEPLGGPSRWATVEALSVLRRTRGTTA
jgi:hypothetical protein